MLDAVDLRILNFLPKKKIQNLEESQMFNDKSPYTIRFEDIADVRHYYVSFFDGENRFCEIEVPRSVFIEIHNSKKIIRNLTRSDERHVENTEQAEETLYNKALNYQKGVEDVVIDMELSNALREAINTLPEVQKRRFIMCYDFGHTYEQIAELEGCSFQAVGKSILLAEEKIKTFLKNRVEK